MNYPDYISSKNIAFFTEGNWLGKIDDTHKNMRTDMAWMCALNAMHFPISVLHTPDETDYFLNNTAWDFAIIILPKKIKYAGYHQSLFSKIDEIFTKLKSISKRVAVMQEGPNWYWQDYDIEDQMHYFNLLRNKEYVDMILCHNTTDENYYRGLSGRDEVAVLPTLMLPEKLSINITKPEDQTGVQIGGNFVSWYGGFDSFTVAQVLSDDIYAPSMGRKTEKESLIRELKHVQYVTWSEWMEQLSKRKYAVHMMRTHAAGTFALNSGWLGIPCIGYRGLDTQETCHPKLTVSVGDLNGAVKLANHLRKDQMFYAHCSEQSKYLYKIAYSVETFWQNVRDLL